MQRAMLMEANEAANAIGQALVNLAKPQTGQDSFENRRYHGPGLGRDVIRYTQGRGTLLVDWAGISSDVTTEREDVLAPSSMRYDVRILHTKNVRGAEDETVYAKQMIQQLSMLYFSAIARDRWLGDLVLDIEVVASFVGDMEDSVTGEELYGHELTLDVLLFNN